MYGVADASSQDGLNEAFFLNKVLKQLQLSTETDSNPVVSWMHHTRTTASSLHSICLLASFCARTDRRLSFREKISRSDLTHGGEAPGPDGPVGTVSCHPAVVCCCTGRRETAHQFLLLLLLLLLPPQKAGGGV